MKESTLVLLARLQDLMRQYMAIGDEMTAVLRELTLRQTEQDTGTCRIHGGPLYGHPGMCEECNPEAFEPPPAIAGFNIMPDARMPADKAVILPAGVDLPQTAWTVDFDPNCKKPGGG